MVQRRTLIRAGLGIFFLVFGVLKFVAGQWFIDGPYKGFYLIAFPIALIYTIGLLQLVMAIAFFINIHVKTASWIAVVMVGATIIATLPKILTLFQLPPEAAPPGFLFFSAIPIFFMALSEALN